MIINLKLMNILPRYMAVIHNFSKDKIFIIMITKVIDKN